MFRTILYCTVLYSTLLYFLSCTVPFLGAVREHWYAHLDAQGLEVVLVLELAHAPADGQQGLGGHAAAVHAGAAHHVALDDGRLQALRHTGTDRNAGAGKGTGEASGRGMGRRVLSPDVALDDGRLQALRRSRSGEHKKECRGRNRGGKAERMGMGDAHYTADVALDDGRLQALGGKGGEGEEERSECKIGLSEGRIRLSEKTERKECG